MWKFSQSQQPESSLASDVYSDASELGKVYTTVGLITGSFISLIFLGIGIYMLTKNNTHTQALSATINSLNCSANICFANLSYNYNNKNYIKLNFSINNTNNLYKTGDLYPIYLDPNNPDDIALDSPKDDKVMGYILVGISILIFGGSIFSWWLSRTSKLYAAAEGTGATIGVVRSAFR